jgi:hypothetical protein
MLQDNDGFHEPLFEEYQKLQADHFGSCIAAG